MNRPVAPLLEVRQLSVSYPGAQGEIEVVRGIDLELRAGETLGLVGESGSGKSQLLLALLQLNGAAARLRGSVCYQGRELIGADDAALRQVRGAQIGIVFQDPMAALNPYLTIGRQITEVRRVHHAEDARTAERHAVKMLEAVHMADPARQLRRYPHELSGGMRQRAMIAMALSAEPRVLLADEPTTALDVTVQAQILSLLRELRDRSGIALLLVTHDMGVIAEMADRVAVMYAGDIVEQASCEQLFAQPRHPYSEALQYCVPRLDQPPPRRLATIAGAPPNPSTRPSGCAFEPRCRYSSSVCRQIAPALIETSTGHWKACHYAGALGKLSEALPA
jgi:oligopeptide/dipeptide ABC transporter ATP-binding protein